MGFSSRSKDLSRGGGKGASSSFSRPTRDQVESDESLNRAVEKMYYKLEKTVKTVDELKEKISELEDVIRGNERILNEIKNAGE